jgi:hypothetical protein
MRPLCTIVLAALAAVGAPLASAAQLVAPAKAPKASLAGCSWRSLGQFPNLVPRALVASAGDLLLAGDDVSQPGRSVMVVLRQPASGGNWEVVDRFLPDGAIQTGARALQVDEDGNAYALAWEQRSNGSQMVLRRSFQDGTAGTWESAESSWPSTQPGGALATDPSGRVYVAYAIAGSNGVGWRVESSLRGVGAFALEDEFIASGVYGAIPFDLERGSDGTLFVAGQLNGEPDEWVVRSRPARRDGTVGKWATIDRYALSPTSYGLVPRAIAVNRDGRLLVAGLGVQGGGKDDYQWIERWQNARGRWRTTSFQLAPGVTSAAQDAARTDNGVAVLGVGYTSTGGRLLLRETTDNGAHWETALDVPGVTDMWSPRLAVTSRGAAVTASVGGSAVVVGCSR